MRAIFKQVVILITIFASVPFNLFLWAVYKDMAFLVTIIANIFRAVFGNVSSKFTGSTEMVILTT
jgi:hypothetical protein